MNSSSIEALKKLIANYIQPSYITKESRARDGIDSRLVTYIDPDSYVTEQFKTLRTNLYSLTPEKQLKSLAITSAHSGEGKTISSANLSFTISLDKEKRVLLIDADLRKPDLHRIFGLPRQPGFSDILQGNIEMNKFFEKPALENLYVIPAGSIMKSPSEVLISSKIRNIIEEMKRNFDYVIFDTPPVLNVTDASILGALCDGVILVVRFEVTPKTIVEEAFNLLRNAQAKPIASILTGYHMPTYYYGKYKYYYKYPITPPKNIQDSHSL